MTSKNVGLAAFQQSAKNASMIDFLTNALLKEINVKAPPIPMVGLRGGGVEEGTRIKNLLTNLSTNYTKSVAVFPYDTYKSNSGIDVPNNVKLKGLNLARLDFSGISPSATALKVTGKRNAPCGFEIFGSGYNDGVKTGLSTIGIDIYGDHHHFEELIVRDFATLIDYGHSDTYLISFDNVFFANSDIILYADMVERSTPEKPIGNAGERMGFTRTTFCNSKLAIKASHSALDMMFTECSFDYCHEFFVFGRGIYNFVNCHLENAINQPNRGTQAKQDWFFTSNDGGSYLFTNCLFDLFNGMTTVVNPASKLGNASYKNCRAFFRAGDGVDRNYHSEHNVYVDINKTTLSVYSPFLSSINWATVLGATNTDKKQIPLRPTVVTDLVNKKYDITFDVATPERTWIKITH